MKLDFDGKILWNFQNKKQLLLPPVYTSYVEYCITCASREFGYW